jgi:hypothetical protein
MHFKLKLKVLSILVQGSLVDAKNSGLASAWTCIALLYALTRLIKRSPSDKLAGLSLFHEVASLTRDRLLHLDPKSPQLN